MYKLLPSDFAYTYQECKLCYYLKIKHNVPRPSLSMPGVFSAINTRIQTKLVGQSPKTLSPDLPDGQIVSQENFVESTVIPNTSVYIKGKYDLLLQNPDNTHTLIDLKISQPGEDKIDKYQTQLVAYKYAFENPKTGNPLTISRLGLLIFYPSDTDFQNGIARLDFPPKWLEVPVDLSKFFELIKNIDQLLAGPPPPESPDCPWCQYRRQTEFLNSPKNIQQSMPF